MSSLAPYMWRFFIRQTFEEFRYRWNNQTLRSVSKTAICFNLNTRFVRTVTSNWFKKTIFVPILLLLFSSRSLLLPFLLPCCFYRYCFSSYVGVLLVIIIGVIVAAIVVIFWHCCYYCIIDLFFLTLIMYHHCFQCYHFYYWSVISISVVFSHAFSHFWW